MAKRYVVASLLLFISLPGARSQAFGVLNLNDVTFRMFSNGYAGGPAFEVPQGNGTHVLSGSGLWLTGTDALSALHTAGWLYGGGTGQADFFPGPLRNDGTASTSQSSSQAHDRVWVVTRQQIDAHQAYHICLGDPNCDVDVEFPGGYTTPMVIAEWPAMGDVSDGYDPYLAPFHDFNLDGTYNAQDGDAPCILGDQAFFVVFNDNLGPHTESLGLPFGMEVQVMGFVYDGTDPALDQTVFLRFHLINRSAVQYQDFHVGYFSDIDVGCPNDDFIGTDPLRNLQFTYNWQDTDAGCLGAQGYGPQPPAVGMSLIKGPLLDPDGADDAAGNAIPAWNGGAFGDGIADNERHGLSHSIYFNRESPNWAATDPSQASHWVNYLTGFWKDGTPLTYGGNGYSTAPDAVPARYIFPGDNDPVGAGTGGQVMAPWAETAPTPTTPDRRGVMGSGPITLDPGEHVDLLFAYVYARAAGGGAFASVGALQARVDSVRAFAQSLPIWDVPENQPYAGMCPSGVSGVPEAGSTGVLALFPTPSSDLVRFTAPRSLVGGVLTVRDGLGRVVMQQRVAADGNTLDVGGLANGVYSCVAVSRNARFTGRLVKE